MITMSILTDMCQWWWLWWLLPFLLGLLLGWILWGRCWARVRELEDELGRLKVRLKNAEAGDSGSTSFSGNTESSGRSSNFGSASLTGDTGDKGALSSSLTGSTGEQERGDMMARDKAKDQGSDEAAAGYFEDDEGKDNLQVIEGIGPKMEGILNDNDVNSYQQLADSRSYLLNAMLRTAGHNPDMHDTPSWIEQAEMAQMGDWSGLREYQLDYGSGNVAKVDKYDIKGGADDKKDAGLADSGGPDATDSGGADVADPGSSDAADAKGTDAADAESSDAAKAYRGGSADVTGSGVASLASGGSSRPGGPTPKYALLKDENLQIIEGIGPKMESILHENGYKTWKDVAGKSGAEIKSMLNQYGDKYRIIDPSNWPMQARMASEGKWDELIAKQKVLGGADVKGSDSKAEKVMIKLGILKKWVENDLKAVEGIGPKIEKLLHENGIKTWEALANTSVDKLSAIIESAGKRFKLADPGTWPRQARLAADGAWDDLEKYQDYLQGGKEPS